MFSALLRAIDAKPKASKCHYTSVISFTFNGFITLPHHVLCVLCLIEILQGKYVRNTYKNLVLEFKDENLK